MSEGAGTSTFVIRWVNFFTMLLAVGVISFGVWMSTNHDGCHKSLTLPVIVLGAVIFVVSIIGFLGAVKNNSILLWIVSFALAKMNCIYIFRFFLSCHMLSLLNLPLVVSCLALHHIAGNFGIYCFSVYSDE